MKKLALAVFLLFVALFFVACEQKKSEPATQSQEPTSEASSALDTIKQNGVIRIGVFSDKPPFGYIDASGVNQGYDIVFAKRIAAELLGDENKVQFVSVEAANRVEFLKSDKVDVILANFTQTPERAQQVDFALPYMKVSLGIVVPEGSEITSVEDLKDKKLIVNKGTTADAFFTKNHPEIELIRFDQNTETFNAFKDGRGDALAHDNTLLFAWAKENEGFKVVVRELGSKDVIAPAVQKGNDELRAFIDELIVKLASESFFHKAYETTLKAAFTDDINADDVVIEGGKY
ncbi:cysteine ABC transporter substrate-binding protein [Campylobacter troglodytis]|uniref:cysteine ABC transporter substrate-binding protein n=1 Tax=Campylobacter troglodytis TaxID=654363 RepID=UPI0011576780|nr:cysteine ABC transporter substrate-binding protein [Campylobacter troglodytis]TQR60975.1 ABC transporter substrate-binding protein [Campylobacter troglodytis]